MRRILAFALVLCMTAQMLPMSVFAEEADAEPTGTETTAEVSEVTPEAIPEVIPEEKNEEPEVIPEEISGEETGEKTEEGPKEIPEETSEETPEGESTEIPEEDGEEIPEEEAREETEQFSEAYYAFLAAVDALPDADNLPEGTDALQALGAQLADAMDLFEALSAAEQAAAMQTTQYAKLETLTRALSQALLMPPAVTQSASGTCGDNLTWTLDDDGVLTITGSGKMTNYDTSENLAPWMQNPNVITEIVVGNGVSSIGDYAFLNCRAATKLVLPASLKTIGAEAFAWCTSLTEVTLPDGLESVGAYSFNQCHSLTKITTSAALTSIGEKAFGYRYYPDTDVYGPVMGFVLYGYSNTAAKRYADANQLAFVVLNAIASGTCGDNLTWTLDDDGVLTITGSGEMKDYDSYSAPWYRYSNVKTVEISQGVTSIGDYAFFECTGLTSVTIPDSVTSIGLAAFDRCTGLTSVTIPEGVTSIGSSAFSNCTGLTSVTIPESVTSIGNDAFYRCTGLTSVTIPESVTRIRDCAFYGCTGLTSVTISEGVTSIGSSAFRDCTGLTSVTIPDSVTSIGNYAFNGCENLRELTIPISVPITSWTIFNICDNISKLHLTKGTGVGADYSGNYRDSNYYTNTPWSNKWDKKITVVFDDGIQSIGSYMFYNCTGLKCDKIPDSVTSVGEKAFYGCTGLSCTNLPASITSFGDEAFYRCTGIKSVTISENVEHYGNNVFRECTGIRNLYLPGLDFWMNLTENSVGASPLISTNSQSRTHVYLNGTEVVNLAIPEGTTAIGSGTFAGWSGVLTLNLPDSLQTIGQEAFSGWRALDTLVIPEGVQSLGNMAFANCSALDKLTISGTPTVGEGAFFGCPNLTAVYLPSRSYWMEHFQSKTVYCKPEYSWISAPKSYSLYLGGVLLTEFTTPDDMTEVPDGFLSGCKDLRKIVIGDQVTKLGTNCFSADWNSNGSVPVTVSLGKNLQVIGNSAFEERNIDFLHIPESVQEIQNGAFFGSRAVIFDGSVPTFGSNGSCFSGSVFYRSDDPYAIPGNRNNAGGTWYAYDPANPEILTSGKLNATITWTLMADGTLKFTGTGKIPMVYSSDDIPWYPFCDSISQIDIGKGITSVGNLGFYNKDVTVYVPSSVTELLDIVYCNWYTVSYHFSGNAPKFPAHVSSSDRYKMYYPAGNTTWNSAKTKLSGGNIQWIPVSPTAYEGKVNDSITWSLSTAGDLILDGTGAMPDYADGMTTPPWSAYTGSIKNLIVAGSITRVGSYSFAGCTQLTSVTLAASVNEVGDGAFTGCTALKSVHFDGSKRGWQQVTIGQGNEKLSGAALTYGVPIYKITYVLSGGTNHPENLTEVESSETIELKEPQRPGYAFDGWYFNSSFKGSAVDYPFGLGCDMTVYAKWVPYSYSIDFDGNGATAGAMKPMSALLCGKIYTLTANAYKRAGYTFDGWNTAPDGSGDSYKAGQKQADYCTENGDTLTLYAQWKPVEYKVVYKNLLATDDNSANPTVITVETRADLNPLEREGFDFEGWYLDAKFKTPISSIEPGNLKAPTYYAKWVPYSYSIAFDGNGATAGAMKPMVNVACGKVVSLTGNAFKRAGYTFNGWNTAPDGSGDSYKAGQKQMNFCVVDGDTLTLYAQWKPISYKVTYKNLLATDDNSANPTVITVETRADLNPLEREGFDFEGWYLDAKYKTPISSIEPGNLKAPTYYAKWVPYSYSIAFDGNGATAGAMKPMVNVACGKVVSLTGNAFKRAGYTFGGWNTAPDGSGDSYKAGQKQMNFCVVDGDILTLYAQWKPVEYKVAYKNLLATDDNSANPTVITVESQADLNPLEREGFDFEGWYLDAKYKTPISSIEPGNLKAPTYYAKWVPYSYSIAFDGNGATAGAMKPMVNVACGKVVTLTGNAFKRAGYTFDGWNTAPDGSGDSYKAGQKQMNFCVDNGDTLILYAQWKPVTYKLTYSGMPKGSTNPNPATFTVEDSFPLAAPACPGKTFVGWFADSKYKNAIEEIPLNFRTANATIYAKWK